jgi:hypothetical protein
VRNKEKTVQMEDKSRKRVQSALLVLPFAGGDEGFQHEINIEKKPNSINLTCNTYDAQLRIVERKENLLSYKLKSAERELGDSCLAFENFTEWEFCEQDLRYECYGRY